MSEKMSQFDIDNISACCGGLVRDIKDDEEMGIAVPIIHKKRLMDAWDDCKTFHPDSKAAALISLILISARHNKSCLNDVLLLSKYK